MKKNYLIVFMLILVLLLGFIVITRHQYQKKINDISLGDNYLSGDVNGDGKVSSLDYILVRKHILGLQLLSSDQNTRADMNNDGKISTSDYIAIRKSILSGQTTPSQTQYNCDKGTYLDANATTCSTCESGYFCPGGTFSKSSEVQGKNKCASGYTSEAGASSCTPNPVEKQPNLVQSLTLNQTSVTLDVGKYAELLVTVNPSNADNKEVSWTSSNFDIATVDQNGIVTAKKGGIATITVTSKEGGKTATCEVTVNKKVYDPIVPTSTIRKYEGTTLKYYVQNKQSYYLTYIWMEDPYNQIRKLDATTAEYGKVMTDDELAQENKKLVKSNVGTMMNNYISKGLIPKEKAAIGFNASGFYVKGSWNPPDDYYNIRSSSWLVITDGKITRNRMADAKIFSTRMIGISSSGDLKIYDYTYNNNNAQQVYDAIMADKVKNTWDFNPELVRDGKVVDDPSPNAKRQAICQIDGNNYVMYTSIYSVSFNDVANVFVDIGCKTAFNLDGGGSTSLFIKKTNSTYATKVKCSDGSTRDKCRSIVEGIYFTE